MNHIGKSILVAKYNQVLRQCQVGVEERLKIIFDFAFLKNMMILKILYYIPGEISFNAINYTISKRNYSIIPIK